MSEHSQIPDQSHLQNQAIAPVFDRQSLARHTMHDAQLELEILGLFLDQLNRFEQADWQDLDMNFEMHTLRGAAAAVGADEIAHISHRWREYGVTLELKLRAAIGRFRGEAAAL